MNRNKAVVISVDAMITSDIEILRSFNEAADFFRSFAWGEKMLSVYPSLTYPCHISILTGCYPDKHGIINNDHFDPNSPDPDWYWYDREHRVRSLLDYAKDNGLTTASIGWPGTGGADVDYLISKIWSPEEEDEDRVNSASVKEIYHKYSHLLKGHAIADIDRFSVLCTCDIIERYRPDLTLSYLALIDSERHKKGAASSLHYEALHEIARGLGRIADSVKKAGMYEDTTFILVSDHGQIDVKHVFNINVELAKRGYIWRNPEGLIEWKVISHSTAFGGEIYTKDIDKEEAAEALEEIRGQYPEELERILNRYEMESIYHLTGPFDFIAENQTGIAMGKAIDGPVISKPGMDDYKSAIATHGHAPEKGAKATFVISGKMARENARVREASIIDEAPTILSIFGIEMKNIDGKPLKELIR